MYDEGWEGRKKGREGERPLSLEDKKNGELINRVLESICLNERG